MGRNWREKIVRCPFYLRDDSKTHKIICEGLGDAQCMAWYFSSRDERQRIRQMEIFCQGRYENCELYRVIRESKYDD